MIPIVVKPNHEVYYSCVELILSQVKINYLPTNCISVATHHVIKYAYYLFEGEIFSCKCATNYHG